MSDLGVSNVLALSDDLDGVKAFVQRIRRSGELEIQYSPANGDVAVECSSVAYDGAPPPRRKRRLHDADDTVAPIDYITFDDGDGWVVLEPQITTLEGAQQVFGRPPVRLKWQSQDQVAAAVIFGHCRDDATYYNRADLQRIARHGYDGFSMWLKFLSREEFPDIYFLCNYFMLEGGWLVCWHLLKAGNIRHGGVFQRTNWRHGRRFVQIANRWCGPNTVVDDKDYKGIGLKGEEWTLDPARYTTPRMKSCLDLSAPEFNHGVVSY